MHDIFNSREIAIIIWIAIFFLISLFRKSIRISYVNLFQAFLNWKITIPFLLMFIYIAISVYYLNEINIWHNNQSKNTILWFITSAGLIFFRINTIKNPEKYFFESFKDNFKIIILLEFIITFYTFELIFELFLIPFLFLLGATKVIAETKKEYKILLPIVNFILGAITLSTFIYTIFKLYTSFDSFLSKDTFYDLIIPILLSIIIIPFHYFLYKYMIFESVYFRLKLTFHKKNLVKYSFIKSLISFKFNKDKIDRWLFYINTNPPKTKKDVKNSINKIKDRVLIEKRPPVIDRNDGWSPFSLIDFLKTTNVNMGNYKESNNNEWYSCSNYIELQSEETLKNNIAFYIEGTSNIATELKIILNINDLKTEAKAIDKLIHYSKALAKFTTEMKLENRIIKNLKEGKDLKNKIDIYQFEIIKILFINQNNYELKFVVSIIKPNNIYKNSDFCC